jgi:uncharacterized protein (TIGR01777 family)
VKVALTGSKGLIGSALAAHLRAGGHQVLPIVRQLAGADEVRWNPAAGTIETDLLHGLDAVVHLAGAGVADHRWSDRYKQEILSSRIQGTTTLARALAQLPDPPSVMVSASAVGYYGDRGDDALTEDTEPGQGFLPDVCAQWEAATIPASSAGIRVATLRSGVVLSAAGGALKKQLLMFRLGLGARLGGGTQQFSWITRGDAVRAIAFLIGRDDAGGPFNLTAPHPVSNAVFTQELARALHRPAWLAVPEAVLRVALGREMAAEFLLASQRAVPERLLAAGFSFAEASLPEALVAALLDRSLIPITP